MSAVSASEVRRYRKCSPKTYEKQAVCSPFAPPWGYLCHFSVIFRCVHVSMKVAMGIAPRSKHREAPPSLRKLRTGFKMEGPWHFGLCFSIANNEVLGRRAFLWPGAGKSIQGEAARPTWLPFLYICDTIWAPGGAFISVFSALVYSL